MREIKFRARRKDNGCFVYGYLLKMFDELSIMAKDDENTVYPVDEESISQYTGLNDEQGIEIYEGDSLEYSDGEDSFMGTVFWLYDGWFLSEIEERLIEWNSCTQVIKEDN